MSVSACRCGRATHRAGQRAPNRKEEDAMATEAHIESLVEKHAHIQAVIDDEAHRPLPDPVRITQLKREKLKLKEQITRLKQ